MTTSALTTPVGDDTLTVEFDGYDRTPGDSGDRPRYSYVIRTSDWEYAGNDVRGGVGAEPDLDEAMQTITTFLYACGSAQRYPSSDNRTLFPEHVAQWAYQNEDELAILSAEPE